MNKGVSKLEKVGKTLLFPKPVFDEIMKYKEENMIATFTAALLELVRKGLAAK